MLAALLYHRIGKGKYANTLEMMRSHLMFLKEHYPIVLPGDPISTRQLSICLTFDDATYDFYHYIFPLLKELNLRALLGVPVRYIVEKATVGPEERLSIPFALATQDGFFEQKAPFCTWEELREMVSSGFVEVACHSFSHPNLLFPFVDLEREVVHSKIILEEHLPQDISSFIYPFGKASESLHQFVIQHYGYAFRIGSGLNWDWNAKKRPLLRISADAMRREDEIFSFSAKTKYFFKMLSKAF